MKGKLKIRIWGTLRTAVFILCIAALWWYFRTYELFITLILAAVFPFLSVMVLWLKKGEFDVRAVLPRTGIGKEHRVPFELRTRNACRVMGFAMEIGYQVKNVFTDYASSEKLRVWAAPGDRIVQEKEMLSHHLGRVEVAVTEFSLFDWLGICSVDKKVSKSAWVVVGPMRGEAPGEELTKSIENFPDENETKKRGIDLNPDYEIREYIPGDDLKNIHWKLTAKTGRTMVRERLSTGREKINVLLALTRDADENDGLVTALQGLGMLLLDKGYPLRLCWLGRGNQLQAHYLAEEGELENAMDEILSTDGIKDPEQAKTVMETEFPGEAYVLVKSGLIRGTYVRQGAD